MKMNERHLEISADDTIHHLRNTANDSGNQTRYCILMTACIDPNLINEEKNIVARIDPQVRMGDYKRALTFWNEYESPIENIVFVENSGADLSEIYEITRSFKKNIEIIQFKGSPIPKGVHYGYAESEMIDYAVDQSRLIKASDKIIKVTGRLTFPRLARLLNWLPAGNEFLSDSRDFALLKRKRNYILTTLFIVNVSFYRSHLYNTKHLMSRLEFSLMEVLYFEILKPMFNRHSDKVILRFPFNVEPTGFGAAQNVNYRSYKSRALLALRGIVRSVLPQLWI